MNPARMKIAALVAVCIAAMTSWATVGPDPSDPTTLLADVAEGDTETYAEKISRSYTKLVKTGQGTLVLTAASSQSSQTDFMGTVEIREGILESRNAYALKECSYAKDTSVIRLSVAKGAQLRLVFASLGQAQNVLYNVGVSGDGPDGKGAIVWNGSGPADCLIRHLHLADDASIGGTGRIGIGYWGMLYLNGHTLTGRNNEYYFRDVFVTAANAGNYVKEGGSVTFQRGEHQTYLKGGPEHTFTLNDAQLNFWSGADLEASWTLKLLNSKTIFVHTSSQWAGPVVGDGNSLDVYSDNANAVFTFSGGITNVATLRPHNSGGASYKLNLANSDHHLGAIVQNKSHVTITGGLHQVMGYASLVDYESSLKFIDAGDVRFTNGMSRVYSGSPLAPSRIEVLGKTAVNGSDGTRLIVGDHTTDSWGADYPNYWGTLTVADGAVMTNDIYVGLSGRGAVYQRDSEIYEKNGITLGYGKGNAGGVKAYGYWGASNSHLTVNGPLKIAAYNSTGTFVQQGGLAEVASNNSIYVSETGHATVHVKSGGTFRQTGNKIVYFGGSGDGGSAAITVEGEGSLVDFETSPISWMCHKNFNTYLNLNDGGVFSCHRFQYEGLRSNLETSRSFLSFNGGCLRLNTTENVLEYRAFMQWGTPVHESHPDRLLVFEGGAVFDTATSNSIVHFDSDIQGPTGKSVVAIALPTDEEFLAATHLGALRVVLEDTAGGEGANAYVAFDDVTGKPSKVVVTSPGVNYHEGTTTAKVMPMRGDTGWECAVTLADAVGGGIVKKGPGTLILRGRASYPGATTICQGTLQMATSESLPQGQPLIMAGGTLNVNSNAAVFGDVEGFGRIVGEQGSPLTIGGKMTLAASDAVAGRTLVLNGVVPTFGSDATIELDATGLPSGSERFRLTLVTSSNAMVGVPSVSGVPEGWRLRFSDDRKRIVLGRKTGFVLLVK